MARERLSQSDDWQLVHEDQDIRGHRMMDARGNPIGTVSDLIVNTDTELVETIVLDDGTEYSADEIEIDDQQAYLKGTAADADRAAARAYEEARIRRATGTAGTATGFAAYDAAFREHYRSTYGEGDYSTYEPAYRHGHRYGTEQEYAGHAYTDLRPEIQRSYEERHGQGTYTDMEEAVRHAFNRSRRRSS